MADAHSLNSIGTRTRFYPLSLHRTDQNDPESLHSYFQRLAFSHRIRPRKLAQILIDRHLPDRATNSRYAVFGENGVSMISTGVMCRRILDAFICETGREDLLAGTMLSIENHVATSRLLQAESSVCLECIREDIGQKLVPFSRLLWRIKCVTCCPIHGSVLTKVDRRPESHVPFIQVENAPVMLPGVCKVCGSVGHHCERESRPGSADDIRRAEACRNLLALFPISDLPDLSSSKASFRDFCGSLKDGYAAVCRQAGISKGIVGRWLTVPSARMELGSIADLSVALQISCEDFLRGNFLHAMLSDQAIATRTLRVLKPRDWSVLKRAMEVAAADPHGGISKIQREHGVDRNTLKSADLHLYKFLAARSRQLRVDKSRKKWTEAWRRVQLAYEIVSEGALAPNLRVGRFVDGRTWTPNSAEGRLFVCVASEDEVRLIWCPSLPADIRNEVKVFIEKRRSSRVAGTPALVSQS